MGLTNRNNITPGTEEITRTLVLYICYKLKDQKTFGSTVLNKVLYYIDNVGYKRHKKPISGFTYIKQENGPTPKPHQFLAIRDRLISEGLLTIEEVDVYGLTRKVPKALKKPDPSIFSEDQLKLINEIIDAFKDINASIASDITHNIPAWQIARSMEELPFNTFLLCQSDLTEKDMDWANKVIAEYEKNDKAA